MSIEIKHKTTGYVLFTAETENFDGKYLGYQNFSGADISGLRFTRADLRYCVFTGARIPWASRDVIAAILFQSAGDDADKRAFAGLVLISRDWCWDSFDACVRDGVLRDWIVDTLAPYTEGDIHTPVALKREQRRRLRAKALAERTA